MPTASKPVAEFKATHNAKVVIWDNGEKGLGIKIQSASYKGDDGQYKDCSFWPTDLPSIHYAIWQAMEWIRQNDLERSKER